MVQTLRYRRTAEQTWIRRGHPPIVSDGFVLGETRPAWHGSGDPRNNVGCLPGVARTTVAQPVQAAGAVHRDLTITGKVTISAPDQTFWNCRFTYDSSGDGHFTGGLVQSSTIVAYPTVFERCEFEPSVTWDRYNGLYGHAFTLIRCAITKTVDGMGLYNPSGGPAAIQVLGCWIGWLAWYDDDYLVDPNGTSFPSGRPNGHSDGSGTHNDGFQHGGGSDVEIRGCLLQGAKYNGLNPANCVLDEDGLSYSLAAGNGITPLDDTTGTYGFPQNASALLCRSASGYAPINHVTVVDNWLYNWGHGINLQVSADQGATVMQATVTGNRFGGRWRDYGGTSRFYPIRYIAEKCQVNGHIASAAGLHDDTHGNMWLPDVHESMTIGGVSVAGQPVRIRYDNP